MPTHRGQENRLYCGRRIGRGNYWQGPSRWQGHTSISCRCDGTCGPTNGCQCEGCYLRTFVGQPPVSPPMAQVRQRGLSSEEAFGRIYCGSFVGRGRYHDGPQRWNGHTGRCACDGRCGPGNGCQCSQCYGATFGAASSTQQPLRADGSIVDTEIGLPISQRPSQTVAEHGTQMPTVGLPEASSSVLPLPDAHGNVTFASTTPGVLASSAASSLQPSAEIPQDELAPSAGIAGGRDCCICLQEPVNTCLVPCGHMCVCERCSGNCRRKCPVCRAHVTQVVRTFQAGA